MRGILPASPQLWERSRTLREGQLRARPGLSWGRSGRVRGVRPSPAGSLQPTRGPGTPGRVSHPGRSEGGDGASHWPGPGGLFCPWWTAGHRCSPPAPRLLPCPVIKAGEKVPSALDCVRLGWESWVWALLPPVDGRRGAVVRGGQHVSREEGASLWALPHCPAGREVGRVEGTATAVLPDALIAETWGCS